MLVWWKYTHIDEHRSKWTFFIGMVYQNFREVSWQCLQIVLERRENAGIFPTCPSRFSCRHFWRPVLITTCTLITAYVSNGLLEFTATQKSLTFLTSELVHLLEKSLWLFSKEVSILEQWWWPVPLSTSIHLFWYRLEAREFLDSSAWYAVYPFI